MLTEEERFEMLSADDVEVRAGAAYSFFNAELSPKVTAALLDMARSDADTNARSRAWQALSDAVSESSIRDALIAALNDPEKPVVERGGAAVGLHLVADRDDVRRGLEALYAMGGQGRVRSLEAMWRSLWPPHAKYFPGHLNDSDPEIVVRYAAGYFRSTASPARSPDFSTAKNPTQSCVRTPRSHMRLRCRGETTRGRVHGMLRKIDPMAGSARANKSWWSSR